MTQTSALNVAGYICDFQSFEANLNISHLKLQKLVFYCQAFHLALHDAPLFRENVEAWALGPVIREVYQEYKIYGNSVIAPSEIDPDDDISTSLNSAQLATITAVLNAYGHLSAPALVEKTHRETPWQEAFEKGNGTIIKHDAMKNYYKDFLVDDDED